MARLHGVWAVSVSAVLLLSPPAAASASIGRASFLQTAAGTEAQAEAAPIVALRLNDGSVIYGWIESETADRVVFRTLSGGLVEVDRSQIASLEPARGTVVDGEFRPADPNATRLLFAPTARSLRQGEGYVGVYEFLLPFVQVGITDRLSMGAGTPLFFFVGDQSGRPIWLTPKYQFYRAARTSAAAGVMHFLVVGEDARLGLAYVVATRGSDDNALTVGLGWAYARYQEDQYVPCTRPSPTAQWVCPPPTQTTETHGSPVFMIGGERRMGRRTKFVTENYAFESGGIVSVGVRFLGERLSADLGLFAPVGAGEFIAAPVVNFVWMFGR